MLYKLQQYIIRKLIAKERKRQIKLGYTLEHDAEIRDVNPNHLIEQAWVHFMRGHYIQTLALFQAQDDLNAKPQDTPTF